MESSISNFNEIYNKYVGDVQKFAFWLTALGNNFRYNRNYLLDSLFYDKMTPTAQRSVARLISAKRGSVMITIIIIFSVLTALAGLIILLNPDYIFGFLNKYVGNLIIHIIAVILRFSLGILFITQAAASKYPAAIEFLGWITIIAAVILAFIGRKKFISLMNWATALPKNITRFGGIFAFCFGAFILYAFI